MIFLRMKLKGKVVLERELDKERTYSAGRAHQADLRMETLPGISRLHFHLRYESDSWKVSRVSKYGPIYQDGVEVDEVIIRGTGYFSVPPYDFEIIETPVAEAGAVAGLGVGAVVDVSAGVNAGAFLPVVQGNLETPATPMTVSSAPESVNALDRTRPGRLTLKAQLRVRDQETGETGVHLIQNDVVVVGRDTTCEIQIPSSHLSRRQFEINLSDDGYAIIDLGGANRTRLNGEKLLPNKSFPLRSGDEITAAHMFFVFEIVDANYESKLAQIQIASSSSNSSLSSSSSSGSGSGSNSSSSSSSSSSEVSFQPPSSEYYPAVPADYPVGPTLGYPPPFSGRVERVSRGDPYGVLRGRIPLWKRKPVIGAGVVLLVFIWMMSGEPDQKAEKKEGRADLSSTGDPTKALTFEKLDPERKREVMQKLALAKQLYQDGKFELAINELTQLHSIVPFYQDSKELLGFAVTGRENLLRVQEIETRRRMADESRALVQAKVNECREMNSRTTSLAEMQACLAPALEMDPENIQALQMLEKLREAERQKRVGEEARVAAAQRVERAHQILAKARQQTAKNNFLEALELYKQYLNASAPEPSEKKTASREMASVEEKIQVQKQSLAQAAEQMFKNNQLKEAVENYDRALKLFPADSSLTEGRQRVIAELRKLLKSIYEDSVLEESVGRVDTAKEKWKKIVELDLKGDEYYKKARLKLQQYGVSVP